MFFNKKYAKHASMDDFDMNKFLNGIKSDMTNRAAIAAKQGFIIEQLVKSLEDERKELRAMRVAYDKKMKRDEIRFEKLVQFLVEKKKKQ